MDSRSRHDSGAFTLRRRDGREDGAPDARAAAIMTVSAKQRTNEGGFTLIEALVALALMGLVLSALANLTAQWLPNWNRGLNRVQRSELIGIALQRIADDLAAAQSVPFSGADKKP